MDDASPKKTDSVSDDASSYRDEDSTQSKKGPCCAACCCMPVWITSAAPWMKGVIVLASALLVGAIVLLTVAAVLETSDNSSSSSNKSSLQEEANAGANANPTLSPYYFPVLTPQSPTDMIQPVIMPATISPNPTLSKQPSNNPTFSMQPSEPVTPEPTGLPSQPPTTIPSSTPTTAMPTGMPFPGQTDTPTTTPTTGAPSLPPSTTPTDMPSPSPTATPSSEPSAKPSARPSLVPTITPSTQPSVPPSPLPTVQTTTVFYLTAGRPAETVLEQFQDLLSTIPTTQDSFMVHLGDWNSPLLTSCQEQSYVTVDQLYNRTSVPVFFIPGDNEYNDCPDPDTALQLWYTYLLNYETKYWPEPSSYQIQRDNPRFPENFAFLLRNVLYVGIHLVGGKVHDADEWSRRQRADLDWIEDQYYTHHRDGMDVMVVFAHADPDIQNNRDFYDTFLERVRDEYEVPIILIHRNLGSEQWDIEENYDNINDFVVVVAEGALWPPMRIEVDTIRGKFEVNQNTWYDELQQQV